MDDDFRTLFEFLPIGAYRSTPEGRMLRSNAALVRLNGCDSEADLHARVHDIGAEWYVDPSRRDEFKARLERDGRVVGFISEIRRQKTRERIWIRENAHVLRHADGSIRCYEGTVEEITAEVQTEQALRDEGQRWKRALESIGDAVWDWNLESGVEVMSGDVAGLYGYAPDELLPTPETMDGLTHPDDVPEMLRAREDHFAGRTRVYVNEHRIRRRDGRWKWVRSRGLVIDRASDGRPLRMIGTHTDIDAARHADDLARERDRVAAADRAKSEFLSRVSHELRTPLNAVLGFAQLLGTPQAGLAPQQAAWVGYILSSGRHLLALVDDVLDLSSVETGQLRLKLQSVDLDEVVTEVLSMFEPEAAAVGVQLLRADRSASAATQAVRADRTAPAATQAVRADRIGSAATHAVRADRVRCRQIVANLISNAVKYNRPGGRVEVRIESGAGHATLTVQDDGPGIDASRREDLFAPFERLQASRGGVKGTGLGLALSRQLATAQQGRLELVDGERPGACFALTLPLAAAAPAEPPPSADGSSRA